MATGGGGFDSSAFDFYPTNDFEDDFYGRSYADYDSSDDEYTYSPEDYECHQWCFFREDSSDKEPPGEVGGYDYQFVSEVPDSLICLICTNVAREAHQVDCCGKVFCKSCLRKLRRGEHNACPNCRKNKWRSFSDKKSVRDINALKVKCSNHDSGCTWQGELGEMEKHVSKCGTELVPCKYTSIGCKCKVLKKNLSSHEDDCTAQHLKMAMEKIDDLTKRLQALEVASSVAINTPPVVFKMPNFSHHKNSKTLWESPPFFTHPQGYKLYLQVNPCGFNMRAISVKVCLMCGRNDENLLWPFKGVVSYQLLNQDADINHRSGTAKFLERKESERNRRVSVAQGKSVEGWGVNDMLLFSNPDFWSYVQKDCLYIKVSEVDVHVAIYKPWLL